jgi:hypothetical protein
MLRRHRAALNPRTTAGPLVAHQQPHLSRAAGSFLGQLLPFGRWASMTVKGRTEPSDADTANERS